MLEHCFVRVLQRDDGPKEINVLRFFGHEEDLGSRTSHGDGQPPTRYCIEWQWQNRDMAPLQATAVSPRRPWREPNASIEFGIVFGQPGIVEITNLIQRQYEPLSEVMIELQTTAWLEQDSEELHAIAEIC